MSAFIWKDFGIAPLKMIFLPLFLLLRRGDENRLGSFKVKDHKGNRVKCLLKSSKVLEPILVAPIHIGGHRHQKDSPDFPCRFP